MKSWKEVPNLFANGKFKFKENNGREWELTPALSTVIGGHHTLIARPISDMSDEETGQVLGRTANCNDKFDLAGDPSNIHIDGFLKMIELGVYPFDQSHFESGEVIARYENK